MPPPCAPPTRNAPGPLCSEDRAPLAAPTLPLPSCLRCPLACPRRARRGQVLEPSAAQLSAAVLALINTLIARQGHARGLLRFAQLFCFAR